MRQFLSLLLAAVLALSAWIVSQGEIAIRITIDDIQLERVPGSPQLVGLSLSASRSPQTGDDVMDWLTGLKY